MLCYVMLILMLLAPQMNIMFAISTSNNPIINKIYAWERWRTSAWYLPNIPQEAEQASNGGWFPFHADLILGSVQQVPTYLST